MEFDWFTITAQIVNFLILVALLHRFLYRPLLGAMAARDKALRERLENARSESARAHEEADRLATERAQLEADREQTLAEARTDAEALRERLAEEVRADIAADRARWRTAIDRERAEFADELRRHTAETVTAIARRVLRDLADEDLEHRAVTAFVDKLAEAPRETWESLRETSSRGGEELEVRSAFPLPDDARQRIETIVREHLASDRDADGGERGPVLRFHEHPEIVCGIELRTRGQKVAWSVGDHLAQLDEAFVRGAVDSSGADVSGEEHEATHG